MATLELTGIVTLGGNEPHIGGVSIADRVREAFPELGALTACVASGGSDDLYAAGSGGATPTPDFAPTLWLGDARQVGERLSALDGQIVHVRVDDI